GDTLRGPANQPFDDDVPPASGAISNDFTAAYVSGFYRTDVWSADSRLEMRHSDTEDRYGWYSGMYREEIEGHGLSFHSDFIYSDLSSGLETIAADIRLGWAFRPWDSEWIVLNRLDLVYDETSGGGNDFDTWRLINNTHANWRWNLDNQLGLHYGAKYVRTNVTDMTFTGFTDIIGVDYRRDLGKRWDVGGHFDLLHSWNSDVFDYGFGLDVGFNVATNMWFSLGYNFSGFDDDDFSQSRYTAQGPYLRFRIKADQQNLSELRKTMAPTHSTDKKKSWP
ncbi:MAG: hypothetical protein HKM24_08210, partial [Gammaproteobacteria bacterium]|nr:hypothetical protein [Gammaproteobacteria bacterium]